MRKLLPKIIEVYPAKSVRTTSWILRSVETRQVYFNNAFKNMTQIKEFCSEHNLFLTKAEIKIKKIKNKFYIVDADIDSFIHQEVDNPYWQQKVSSISYMLWVQKSFKTIESALEYVHKNDLTYQIRSIDEIETHP